MEKTFSQTVEAWVTGTLGFFYGFLRTSWQMLRHPSITAEQLSRQDGYAASDFTPPFTYFILSFLLNFSLLRALFTVLHQGKKVVEAFLPTLLESLSNPLHIDPITAFILIILKSIPLFGVILLMSGILGRRLRFSALLQKTSHDLFCYCAGFFWNALTACLLVLLGFAYLWALGKHQEDAHQLLSILYALLAGVSVIALLCCYRFSRRAFKAMLSQDITEERTALPANTLALSLLSVGIVIGLITEYGLSLLEAILFNLTGNT